MYQIARRRGRRIGSHVLYRVKNSNFYTGPQRWEARHSAVLRAFTVVPISRLAPPFRQVAVIDERKFLPQFCHSGYVSVAVWANAVQRRAQLRLVDLTSFQKRQRRSGWPGRRFGQRMSERGFRHGQRSLLDTRGCLQKGAWSLVLLFVCFQYTRTSGSEGRTGLQRYVG